MRNYAPLFDELTERQRTVMGRLAVDDGNALTDKATVNELMERGLIWEGLDEIDGVTTLFMPLPVHIAWCRWYADHMPAEDRALLEDSERLTAEDIANAVADADTFLARAEAERAPQASAEPPPLDVYDSAGRHTDREAAIGEADPPPPRRRPGRPRKAR